MKRWKVPVSSSVSRAGRTTVSVRVGVSLAGKFRDAFPSRKVRELVTSSVKTRVPRLG